jgi:hypothetical protein
LASLLTSFAVGGVHRGVRFYQDVKCRCVRTSLLTFVARVDRFRERPLSKTDLATLLVPRMVSNLPLCLLRFTSTGHALSRETRATFPLSQAATMPRLTQLTVGRFPISWCFWMATTGLHRFGSLRQKVLRSRPTYLNPCIRKAEEDEEHHSRFDSAQQRLKEVVALL